MTKKRLKRMRSLISEARHLQEMLDRPAKTTEYVGDTAKDYRTGKPHKHYDHRLWPAGLPGAERAVLPEASADPAGDRFSGRLS